MYKKQMKGKLCHNSCVSACRSWLIHHWKARYCADVRCWWWGSGSHSLSPSIGLQPTAPYLRSWLWLTQHCRYPMPYQQFQAGCGYCRPGFRSLTLLSFAKGSEMALCGLLRQGSCNASHGMHLVNMVAVTSLSVYTKVLWAHVSMKRLLDTGQSRCRMNLFVLERLLKFSTPNVISKYTSF